MQQKVRLLQVQLEAQDLLSWGSEALSVPLVLLVLVQQF